LTRGTGCITGYGPHTIGFDFKVGMGEESTDDSSALTTSGASDEEMLGSWHWSRCRSVAEKEKQISQYLSRNECPIPLSTVFVLNGMNFRI
jgi:hypothetical protein